MICSKCGLDKDENSFSWKIKGKRRQSICRGCTSILAKKYYEADKQAYKARARKSNPLQLEKTKALITELKSCGCVQCGDKRIPVLQFHHLDPSKKEWNIAHMATRCSRKKIIAEAKKCIVLCSNCHIMKHSNGDVAE